MKKQDLGLLLDTSTERGILAICQAGRLLWKKELPTGLQNSQTVMPALVSAFNQLGLIPSQLSYVATGIGPGSYTGIRVAVMLAKAMAFSINLPLIGICSLQGFIPEQPGKFLALIDAKIGGVYALEGEKLESGKIDYHKPTLLSLIDLPPLVERVQFILTPHLSLKNKGEVMLGQSASCPLWIEMAPSAEKMLQIAEEKLRVGDYSLDASVEILYLRQTQAEIEKQIQTPKL